MNANPVFLINHQVISPKMFVKGGFTEPLIKLSPGRGYFFCETERDGKHTKRLEWKNNFFVCDSFANKALWFYIPDPFSYLKIMHEQKHEST